MNFWDNFAKLFAILLMMAGIPAFMFLYRVTKDPVASIILLLVYEIVIFIGSFITKIWEHLEGKWTERLANRIDLLFQFLFSGYRHRYLEYTTYQHRFFDVKGLRTQGPCNLELEKIFVQLSVDPTPIHQTSSNPLHHIPEMLLSGSHSIWEFINSKGKEIHNLAK